MAFLRGWERSAVPGYSEPRDRQQRKGPDATASGPSMMSRDHRFLAGAFLAVVFFAGAFLAVVFFAGAFLAGAFLAVVFFAGAFLAADLLGWSLLG